MKRKLFKSMVVAGAVAMICACGDDAASNNASDQTGYEPGTDVIDNPNPSDGTINSVDSQNPNSSPDGNNQDPNNPASSAGNNGQNPADPTSSAGANPNDPTSSAGTGPTVSSSSVNSNPELGPDGFPTLESYGAPSPAYTKDISATAKRGWNTRYWDACKPHCSWLRESANDVTRADTSSDAAYIADYGTARNCNIHDVEVPTFTLGDVSRAWFGYNGTRSACGEEKEKGVFTCTDMAPIAVNDTLSYAYVAGTADSKCGKCYHLQYDGHFANAEPPLHRWQRGLRRPEQYHLRPHHQGQRF